MRTSRGLQLAQRLANANNTPTMLALEITDLLEMRDNGYKLKEEDKFILGLGFSEFFALGNTDDDYIKASSKRDEFLKVIGIEFMDLYYAIEKVYGRDKK